MRSKFPPNGITTERLLLRELTEHDLPDLAALYADRVVMRHFPSTFTVVETRERLAKTLEAYDSVGYHLLATINRVENRFIGRCGIILQEIDGSILPEIGYMLHKAYWGQGLAIEAARALREFGFGVAGFMEMFSLIRPENLPSQRVALRNGMHKSRSVIFHGLEHDVYRITRAEWKLLRGADITDGA